MVQIPRKKLLSGEEIPVLGLGTWQMEQEACLKAIPIAYELGYRHIDTAFAYYNEKFIGEAIRPFPRDSLFITSKLWRDFHDVKKVEAGLDQSLSDLRSDYLDLFLIHWPERKNMVDLLGKMGEMKKKGKVKSVGVCNATISHLEEILRHGIELCVNQVEFSPFLHQKPLLSFCQKNQIVVTAYCPIAQGAVFQNQAIVSIGEKHNKTAAQVSLRWLIQKGMVVIPKGSSQKHLEENLKVFDFSLTEEEMGKIDGLHTGKRIVLPDFNEFEAQK